MDVRCEKCQTEYELDESRLKPGGVTVKCTNCGHMFKIRKRTPTNVGLPVERARTPSSVGDRPVRADSVLGESIQDQGSGPNSERQWMVRLENGENRTCRELATLQQWIVAGTATRESLISRSGKTWKRLGDIAELGQYFVIADEARAQRTVKPTGPKPVAPTMLGVGPAQAAGGTILPDDDDERRSTGNFRPRQARTTPPPPPPAVGRPGMSTPPRANPLAQTELATPTGDLPRRPPTQPPPIPQRAGSAPHPMPVLGGNRSTAAWASNEVKASESMAAMPQGPRAGRLSAIPDEPAFSGRVRMSPTDESSFSTGKVRMIEDDDDLLPSRRGSRAGTWIAVMALAVIAGAAGIVYMVAFRDKKQTAAAPTQKDAGAAAVAPPDAVALVVTTLVDAAPVVTDPLDPARAELAADIEPRLKGAIDSLAGKDDPASLAMRARLETALVQAMQDRAGLVEKADGDKLRKDAKQLVLEAAALAQRALKGQADDASANLAMAEVLRLQGKPARDVQRYLDGAREKAAADKELARSVAIADALLAVRDGKLDDAKKSFAAVDAPDDMRVKLALALVAYAQSRPQDAKPIVDQILATQPDHDTARALKKRLETTVANTDPLPPEDGKGSAAKDHGDHGDHGTHNPTIDPGAGGGDYDGLLARANKLAETNCTKAIELYGKALEQKPNGVEALTGQGYCHLDAKQFSSAFSKFRAALATSNRYEPALAGVAETYQQQGNKEQAIDAWRKYLDIYPGSQKAKKQLELLGVTGDAPTPAPPPPPTPTPPALAPAGSDSGSAQ